MTNCNIQITKNCNYCIKGKMCPKQTRVWMLQMSAVWLLERTVQPSVSGSHGHSDALCSLLASLLRSVLGFSVSCGTPGHVDRSSYCDGPDCRPENTSSFSSFVKETLLEWCVGVKMRDFVKEIFCQTIRQKAKDILWSNIDQRKVCSLWTFHKLNNYQNINQ